MRGWRPPEEPLSSTRTRSPRRTSARTGCEPINPPPPVTRYISRSSRTGPRAACHRHPLPQSLKGQRREDRPHEAVGVVAYQVILVDRQQLVDDDVGHELAHRVLVEHDRILLLRGVAIHQLFA